MRITYVEQVCDGRVKFKSGMLLEPFSMSITITIGGNRRLNVSDTSAVWINNEDSPAVDDDGVWA